MRSAPEAAASGHLRWKDSQWDAVLWHNYARSVGVVSDGGSCGAGRRIFSWDFAVKRLIWRQREERTFLQKTGDNKPLRPAAGS